MVSPENVWVPKSLVDGLRGQGHEVTVLTGVPHYPTGTVAEGYRADRFRRETIDGVTVHRVPEYPYRGTGMIGRLAGYASFAVAAAIRALTVLGSVDAVVVYGSPATAALPAMVLRRVPYVLQVQDIWPDSVVDSGFVDGSAKLRFIRAALDAFASLSYRMSSHVTVITPSAVDLLAARGVPREKLTLVYNWIDDPMEQPAPEGVVPIRSRIGADDEDRVFLYAGAMGPPQNLGHVIDGFVAAELGPSAHLVLMGPGVEHDSLAARAETLPTVHVLDPVPIAEANVLLRQATAGIVSLADTPLHRATFPSKVQSMCALGVPVLALAPGDVGTLVNTSQIERTANSGDYRHVSLALQHFNTVTPEEIGSYATNARDSYDTHFAPSSGPRLLGRIIQRATIAR